MADDTSKIKVRFTIHPDEEYEIEQNEYLDLSRQGLIVEDKKTTKPSNSAPANKEEGK